MKYLASLLFLMSAIMCKAQGFDDYFCDKTLRIDYIFSGNNRTQYITLDELSQSPGWYGRRSNLDSLMLKGNGQITVTLPESNKVIYRHSFSTLFQEWQSTEEASKTNKSFENVFIVPFPKQEVDVTVTLSDTHNKETSRFTHRVNPSDILIRHIGETGISKWKYIYKGDDPKNVIDVVIVAEGYTAEQEDSFYNDCSMAVECYHKHEPFASLKDKFNFIGVFVPSQESGVTIPGKNIWKNTALGSNFDTFYSARYLTTLRLKKLNDVLAGIPYEHIIILVNSTNYGGGGIYNSYMMSTAHHATTPAVIVHEFGHSFGGLGDEYFYDDQYEEMYPSDTEPWEPNLTTLVNFESKWKNMLPKGTKIPTKADGKDIYHKVGVYEGGGYQSKGVYRPVQECRMKINEAPEFCPVCDRAIRRLVDFYVKR